MANSLTSKDVRRWFRVYGSRAATVVSLVVLCMAVSSCGSSARSTGGPPTIKAEEPVAVQVDKSFEAEAREAITKLDPAMGDWEGGWKLDDGSDSGPLVAQVIALGKGEYKANFLEIFDTPRPAEPIGIVVGRLEGEAVELGGRANHSDRDFVVKAKIEGGKLTGTFTGQDASGTFALERVFRVSGTMGAKPPKGAVVLFNGKKKSLKQWKRQNTKEGEDDAVRWEIVDGAMKVTRGGGSIITRKKFTNVAVHVEFRSPFMPEARGQGRGNSGVYLQGRYEVQVLDSYGLKGEDNECGGIYKVSAPLVNMCAPPGQWQTYDITFRAATGSSKPTLTVLHNGVEIQDQTPVGGTTTSGVGGKASEPGGLYLQDHGNAVEYRNIWLIEQ